MNEPSVTSGPATLPERIAAEIATAGGWLPFDRFMQMALYAPGGGYYARDARQFGVLAKDGSDFVTAPELSPLFARALTAQIAESLAATGTDEVWEFGAGSGALAAGLIDALDALGQPLARYTIVDVSGALRARQQARLAAHGERVRWASQLPDALRGVVVGNEVLDAMPVKLLARRAGAWHERGVGLGSNRPPALDGQAPAAIENEATRFAWQPAKAQLVQQRREPADQHQRQEDYDHPADHSSALLKAGGCGRPPQSPARAGGPAWQSR